MKRDPREVLDAAKRGEPWAVQLTLKVLMGPPDSAAARDRSRRENRAELARLIREMRSLRPLDKSERGDAR